jgi:hypothetical protein
MAKVPVAPVLELVAPAFALEVLPVSLFSDLLLKDLKQLPLVWEMASPSLIEAEEFPFEKVSHPALPSIVVSFRHNRRL